MPSRLEAGHQHAAVGRPGPGRVPQIVIRAAGFGDPAHAPAADGFTWCGVEGVHAPTLSLVPAKVTAKPLTKILIANRGEIAVRVIRAAREMGIATVAVYSELDRNALHVRLADEAYALGGQTAAESYLNTEAILDAIRKSGADGVHPGYGFFSENADFADAITEMGVAFIGPPGDAIREMGDKVSSRKAALRGGAPIVPGTTEFVTTAAEIKKFGEEYGWPIAIKAAFGGGGRGMKVVRSADEVQDAMDSAQREAKAFFGRDEIYVEKYLTWPRHVEVQLVGDQHGNYVWVSTRDCSAQRRHQKLVEEAPAPALPDGVEDAMGEAAVKAAKAVGYFNAGTVEFIYQEGEFFFLEMNTRLQVEHPVTEVITGIDLVEWQIRVAGGEKLPMTQKEVAARRNGHGIEIRINAENPAGGKFLPSPGKITKLTTSDGFGVRFDSGYEAGDEISQYYDNLVGKLIVWGKDRPTAIARTIRALEEMVVEGVATTIPADIAILRHADFAAVTHSTKWVEEVLDLSGIESPKAPAAEEGAEPLVRRNTTVEVNGKRFDVAMWVPEQTAVAVAAGGAKTAKKPTRASGSGGAAGGGSGEVAAPMQGTIVKVLVEVGATVEAGQSVVVLEAMKMENQIQAEKSGTVKEVRVKAGDTVGGGDILVVIA
jgi:acetyl-CoA/propionyl-CoA carboxylase, biotin carboxylase, biotin carboxyl carrier protein